MSQASAPANAIIFSDFAGLVSAVARWLSSNLRQALISAAIGAAVGYVVNVYLMLMVYDGFRKIGDGPATGEGTLVSGALIWGVGSAILFGLFGYWRSVGNKAFWHGASAIPGALAGLFRSSGAQARIHLLWGAAVGLLTLQIVSPWLSVVLAASLFVVLPSFLGRIFASFLLQVWSALARLVAPSGSLALAGPTTIAVAVLGASLAYVVGFFVTEPILTLVLALGCGGAAWWLGQQKPALPTLPTLLLLLAAGAAAMLLYELIVPLAALADDGGFQENSANLKDWWHSDGSLPLLAYATVGGGAAAAGGAVGTALGHVLATGGDGGSSSPFWWGGNRSDIDVGSLSRPDRAEPAPSHSRKDDAARYQGVILGLRDRAPVAEWDAIDRVLGRVNWNNPSESDLDTLKRLAHALGSQAQGASESAGAQANLAAATAQLGQDVSQAIAAVGQAAGSAVESVVSPGTRGAITGAIYGAAGTMDLNQSAGDFAKNAAGGAAKGAVGAVVTSALPLPGGVAGGAASGAVLGAAGVAIQGGDAEDIAKGAGVGALGGAAGGAFHDGLAAPSDPSATPPEPGEPLPTIRATPPPDEPDVAPSTVPPQQEPISSVPEPSPSAPAAFADANDETAPPGGGGGATDEPPPPTDSAPPPDSGANDIRQRIDFLNRQLGRKDIQSNPSRVAAINAEIADLNSDLAKVEPPAADLDSPPADSTRPVQGVDDAVHAKGEALHAALAKYYESLGQPQPPMHTTTKAALQQIIKSGYLEAPESGASWSHSGTLRDGDVAIRLAPGADKFVKLSTSQNAVGQSVEYYPEGIGAGPVKSYIPTEHLEYFDIDTNSWKPVK